jgi:hypothetical protein
MPRAHWITLPIFFIGSLWWVASSGGQGTPGKFVPKLEPIAETKLIMEGIAHTNYRGLERILSQKPPEEQGWKFARGQALLLAEAANLLMLRPPSNEGTNVWFDQSMKLRAQAKQLAVTIAARDLEKSKAQLVQLAGSCNRCHQTFRVPVEITPFQQNADPGLKKASVERPATPTLD